MQITKETNVQEVKVHTFTLFYVLLMLQYWLYKCVKNSLISKSKGRRIVIKKSGGGGGDLMKHYTMIITIYVLSVTVIYYFL